MAMIKRELLIFLVVGVVTVVIDYLAYQGLILFCVTGIDIAKAAGFVVGTVFAYFANRYWTFGHNRHASGSAFRFGILYVTSLGANVGTNALCLMVLRDYLMVVQLAFLFATALSATFNFLGMKHFVFADKSIEAAQ